MLYHIEPSHIFPVLSGSFLLITKIFTFLFQSFLLVYLIELRKKISFSHYLWVPLFLVLASRLVIDLGWIFAFAEGTPFDPFSSPFYFAFIKIGWLCVIIQHSMLALFFRRLIKPFGHSAFTWDCLVVGFMSVAFFLTQFVFILKNATFGWQDTTWSELNWYRVITVYCFVPLIFAVYHLKQAIAVNELPGILKTQLKVFMSYMLMPYFVLEAISLVLFVIKRSDLTYPYVLYWSIGFSTLMITGGLYFCARQLLRLRFLNMDSEVKLQYGLESIGYIAAGIRHLMKARTIEQLKQSTVTLFNRAFEVSANDVAIHICPSELDGQMQDLLNNESVPDQAASHVHKTLICKKNCHPSSSESQADNVELPTGSLSAYIAQGKILIRDDLEFNHFYQPEEQLKQAIEFLNILDADVFLPLYDRLRVMGYVLVKRGARAGKLFSVTEKLQLIAWSAYLDHFAHIVRYANFEIITCRKKDLVDTAYSQIMQLQHYRESIKYFERYGDTDSQDRKDEGSALAERGTLLYKNRSLTQISKTAQELIGVDIAKNPIHSLTKALKGLGQAVERMQSTQVMTIRNEKREKLIVAGIRRGRIDEQDSVTLLVSRPTPFDVLPHTLEAASPLGRAYGLYLETTKAGKAINELIPSATKTFSHFKAGVLKAGLSKKALLVDLPVKDLVPTIEVIHRISMRAQLHVLRMSQPEKGYDVALKLFGMNPILMTMPEPPLLQQLGTMDTLFIENVHLLSAATQERLAELVEFGFFRPLKSDVKIYSNVRVIFSTPHNLQLLAHDGRFSPLLAKELVANRLYFPSLINIPVEELYEAIDEYACQVIKNKDLAPTGEFEVGLRDCLLEQYPASLYELKGEVEALLLNKKRKKVVYDEDRLASTRTEQAVDRALQLGKNALKDMRVMSVLWKKFKNHSHIATLLGVHRSSVLKRCKEYNLHTEN